MLSAKSYCKQVGALPRAGVVNDQCGHHRNASGGPLRPVRCSFGLPGHGRQWCCGRRNQITAWELTSKVLGCVEVAGCRIRAKATDTGNEAYLQLLIDAVVDYAIYMLSVDGRVLSWNAGAARLKGYEPKR